MTTQNSVTEITNTTDKEPKNTTIWSDELNKYTANFLWWLRFTFVDSNTKKWVVKTSTKSNTYTISYSNREPLQSIISVAQSITKEKLSLWDSESRRFRKNFDANRENFSFSWKYEKEDKKTGEITYTIPTLEEYLQENFSDMRNSPFLRVWDTLKLFTNDPKTPTFNFVDLAKIDSYAGTPTPMIDDWINALFYDYQIPVVRAYLYSVFVERSSVRQALYFCDIVGKNGKTTLINALTNYLDTMSNGLHVGMNSKAMGEKFAFAPYHNKRLATEPDLKSPKIFMTDVFHKITGGDTCSVEKKGQEPFEAVIRCKCILAGNIVPEINTDSIHERSRVIFIKMKQKPDQWYVDKYALKDANGNIRYNGSGDKKTVLYGNEITFQETFNREMPHWIANSKPYYDDLASGSEIVIDDRIWDDLETHTSSEEQDAFNTIFNKHFAIEEHSQVRAGEMKEVFETAYIQVVKERPNNYVVADWKKWLALKGVPKKSKRVPKGKGENYDFYDGVTITKKPMF